MQDIKKIDFEKLYKEEKEGELKVRYLALQHLQSGESRASVARIVLRKWQTIDEWQRKFKEEGLNGLKRKAGQGRKSKLKKSEEERFKKRLNEIQSSKKGGRIIGKDIQNLLSNEFGANYHEDSVYNLLDRLGIVWITARSIHPSANPENQENFKK